MATQDGKCMFYPELPCNREKCGDCSVWIEENYDPEDPRYYGPRD